MAFANQEFTVRRIFSLAALTLIASCALTGCGSADDTAKAARQKASEAARSAEAIEQGRHVESADTLASTSPGVGASEVPAAPVTPQAPPQAPPATQRDRETQGAPDVGEVSPGLGSPTSTAASTKACEGGVRATISGQRLCLTVGTACVPSANAQYAKHGYTCNGVTGRLVKK